MRYEVKIENLDTIAEYWQDARSRLKWDCIFVLPGWIRSWWQAFGADDDLCLLSARDDNEVIGIAPFMVRNRSAHLIGDRDVCDYLDFVVAPEKETVFFNVIIDYLREKDITCLNLAPARHGSVVCTLLSNEIVRDCGCDVAVDQEEVLVEMELPDSWEAYLASLSTKQRREVKRKLKKLNNMGKVDYRVGDGAAEIDIFLGLFTKNKEGKAAFMTPKMQSFFKLLAQSMAEIGILRIGVLALDSLPVAAVMCFDHDGVVYLYNSAYDTQYGYLSVGLISKILCIKDSIEKGSKSFNFLKGAEEYKYRLGGVEVPVYNFRINL